MGIGMDECSICRLVAGKAISYRLFPRGLGTFLSDDGSVAEKTGEAVSFEPISAQYIEGRC